MDGIMGMFRLKYGRGGAAPMTFIKMADDCCQPEGRTPPEGRGRCSEGDLVEQVLQLWQVGDPDLSVFDVD